MDPTDPTPERPWQEPFLAALAESCNVSAASKAAGIDRWTAYDRRRRDEAFRVAWDNALEVALDELEAKARERALAGQSDALLMFLLRAHRPAVFAPKTQTEHTGGVTVRVVYDDPVRDPDPPAEAP